MYTFVYHEVEKFDEEIALTNIKHSQTLRIKLIVGFLTEKFGKKNFDKLLAIRQIHQTFVLHSTTNR